MALYGYARVSTEEQFLERQHNALRARGVATEIIRQERASGASECRPVFDRFSRRTSRIILTLDGLASHGVTVESLYENVDTSTADDLFSVTIYGALAQGEREPSAHC